MQVLHTPRGYGGRLPHPVRGGGAYRDSPPHPLPGARPPGRGWGGLSPSSELLPVRVITATEAGHPIKHRVD